MTSPQPWAAARSSRFVWWSRVLLAAFVIAIVVIVLWPGPPAAGAQHGLRDLLDRLHHEWLPLWVSFSLIEWLSNVLMFVPVGFLGAFALPQRARRWLLLLAFCASALIELIQQMSLPGRTPSVADVVANTLGAALGMALAYLPAARKIRSS